MLELHQSFVNLRHEMTSSKKKKKKKRKKKEIKKRDTKDAFDFWLICGEEFFFFLRNIVNL